MLNIFCICGWDFAAMLSSIAGFCVVGRGLVGELVSEDVQKFLVVWGWSSSRRKRFFLARFRYKYPGHMLIM